MIKGLQKSDIDFIKKTILSLLPKAKIMAFGSRVLGDNKKYSDLDIAIDNQQPLSISEIQQLKSVFEESDLLFQIDLIDFHTTNSDFQKIILKNKIDL